MPPHIIIIGVPLPIIMVIRLQHSMNMSFDMSSIGIISQTMPLAVILQVILDIIIGIIMPIGIMPFIIGIIMPFIGMPPIIMGFIIIGFIGMEPIIGIMPLIIGFICMAVFISKSSNRCGRAGAVSMRGPLCPASGTGKRAGPAR